MTGTETTQLIPYAAWEQAVFVGLFIVLVVGLLAWFTKQSDKWQGFMLTIDEKWRAFNKEQREENNACMSDVNKGLTDLTRVTGQLVQTMNEMRTDIYQHDLQAKEIKHLVENAKPAPKPRAKKSDAPNVG